MDAVFHRLASERLFRWLLGVALALPLFLSRGPNGAISGPPLVTSGDEPHYLLMLHSLVSDHDLDLSNNYDRARLGSVDVGAGRIGVGIDHQVAWYDSKGVWWGWVQVYDYERDAKHKPVPPPALPHRLLARHPSSMAGRNTRSIRRDYACFSHRWSTPLAALPGSSIWQSSGRHSRC